MRNRESKLAARQLKCIVSAVVFSLSFIGCGGSRPAGGGRTNPPPTGNAFVYVSSAATNTISGFSIDNGSGALTAVQGSPFPSGGSAPGQAAVDASQRFLFTINHGSNTVSAYRIDAAAGVLTLANTAAVGTGPTSLVSHPNGNFVYVTSSNGTISGFAFDASGLLSPLPRSPYPLSAGAVTVPAMTTNSAGQLMFVTTPVGIEILQIASDGSLTSLGPPQIAAGASPSGIAIDRAANFLYSLDFGPSTGGAGSIFGWIPSPGIGVNTGLTPLPQSPTPAGVNPVWITITPNGKFAYVGGGAPGSGAVQAFSIAIDGVLTPAAGSAFAAPPTVIQMAVDPSGAFLYTASPSIALPGLPPGNGNVNAFSINANGILVNVPGSPFSTNPPTALAVVRFAPR